MSWPIAQDYTCPLCGERNTTFTVGMSDNFGGEDSELRSYPAGFDPLRFALFTCGACGFTEYLSDAGRTVPEPERSVVRSHLDAIPRETIQRLHAYAPWSPDHAGEDGYEAQALSKYRMLIDLMKIRGAGARRMATAFLEAAWIADDVTAEDPAHQAMELRREALRCFEEALAGGEIGDLQERERVTYLIGELHRRLGQFKDARTWYAKVTSDEAWLNELAKEQIKRAKKKDAALVKYEPKPLFE
jgi:hypothetical protein